VLAIENESLVGSVITMSLYKR